MMTKSCGQLYDVFTSCRTSLANLTSAPQQVALCCFALEERADRNTMEAQIISCDGFTGR